jgi:hypothetical protein
MLGIHGKGVLCTSWQLKRQREKQREREREKEIEGEGTRMSLSPSRTISVLTTNWQPNFDT